MRILLSAHSCFVTFVPCMSSNIDFICKQILINCRVQSEHLGEPGLQLQQGRLPRVLPNSAGIRLTGPAASPSSSGSRSRVSLVVLPGPALPFAVLPLPAPESPPLAAGLVCVIKKPSFSRIVTISLTRSGVCMGLSDTSWTQSSLTTFVYLILRLSTFSRISTASPPLAKSSLATSSTAKVIRIV